MPRSCDIFGERIRHDLVVRVARRDDAELASERDETFENQFGAAGVVDGLQRAGERIDQPLPFAVVSAAHGLEDRRKPDPFRCRGGIRRAADVCELRRRESRLASELLLQQAVLRDVQHAAARRHAIPERFELPHRADVDVLKLVRDDVAAPAELLDRGQVVVDATICSSATCPHGECSCGSSVRHCSPSVSHRAQTCGRAGRRRSRRWFGRFQSSVLEAAASCMRAT